MANVTLLHYNNYFNRIVKKESSYSDYRSADITSQVLTNINFVPGDGITTSLIIGTSTIPDMVYDYLIVSHTSGSTEAIDSRWFIIDEKRTRSGQYEIGLRRDVIVDNYNVVMNAPIFLEKGYVNDTTNPLLYNSESMTYNQIKTSEKLITDSTECAWVVGYIPQDAFQVPTTISKDVAMNLDPDDPGVTSVATLSRYDYYDAVLSNPSGRIWTTETWMSPALKLKWKTEIRAPATPTEPNRYNYSMEETTIIPSVLTNETKAAGNWEAWSTVSCGVTVQDGDISDRRKPSAQSIYGNLVDNVNLWAQVDEVASQVSIPLHRRFREKQ